MNPIDGTGGKHCTDCFHYEEAAVDRPATCHGWDDQVNPVDGAVIDGLEVGFARIVLCGWSTANRWGDRSEAYRGVKRPPKRMNNRRGT